MHQGLVTALLWLGFGGTHVGLTVAPIRKRLVRALGEGGYVLLYSVVAIGTFSALVHYVALHRFEAPHGSLIASLPPVRGALLALSVFGFTLFIAAVLGYPRAPMAVFRHRALPVRGIQQITRHPFFSGIALWAAAHALLALSSVTFVFFFGVIVLSFVGGMHQDRRLIAELGEPYRSYVAATSFWPLVAVATKRQKIQWLEQPWIGYALGIVVSLGLYQVHDHIFDHGGAYVIGVTSLGSIMAILGSRARRGSTRAEHDV
ncbi:MAG: hypothetical protein JSV06_04205 [Myxococcales bacterium]|nr:MAG: hypothetical protein JSV06_04205 [Myxococcales bacterium]